MRLTPNRLREIIKEEIESELNGMDGQNPQADISIGPPPEPSLKQASIQEYEKLASHLIVLSSQSGNPSEILPKLVNFMKQSQMGTIESGPFQNFVANKLDILKTNLNHIVGVMVDSNIIKARK
jgi:hypothetical protein